MNDQIASLKFYLTIIANLNKYSVADLAGHRADCEEFVEDALSDFSNRGLEKQITRLWTSAGAPLSLAMLDIPRYYDEAVRAIGSVSTGDTETKGQANAGQFEKYFEEYIVKECEKDEEAQCNLRNDVNSLWNRLEGFADKNNGRAYGLAVGRVQSGKTRNYIGLMLKALENDERGMPRYNTIVILTSKNRRLAYQTFIRVRDWLDNPKMRVPNLNWLTQCNPDDQSIAWTGGGFVPTGVNVAVVLKNEAGHLTDLKAWMAQRASEHTLGTMRLLFIDDESDNATPNTNSAQESTITSSKDIISLCERVDENCWPDVREWLRGLAERKFDDPAINDSMQEKLRRVSVSRSSLMEFIRDDRKAAAVLGLDVESEVNGQIWRLNARIREVFDKSGRCREPNWCDLRDVLLFLFDIAPERSKINESVCSIVGQSQEYPALFSFEKMAYVAYTATPFANLLNENPYGDPLCPDFVQSLSVSPKYFGLDRIFGGGVNGYNMNIVRTIPSDEYEAWVSPVQSGDLNNDVETISHELVRAHNFADEGAQADVRGVEWGSLKRAIQWAFCTAAARRWIRKQGEHSHDDYVTDTKYRWTTMLFNLSHLSDPDAGVHPVQQRLVQGYVDWARREENRAEFLESCMRVWRAEISQKTGFTKADFEKAAPDYGNIQDYPPESQVKSILEDWFLRRGGKVKVVQMNSKNLDGEAAKYYKKDCEDGDVLWIVCGGNAISRGLTLDGLTVSYYDRVRRGSAVDTVTQMGRWFGYRPEYELLPRVWMTEATAHVMKEICRTENQLHEEIAKRFESNEERSIRVAKDAARIRSFGRRLTSRDANSELLDGVGASDVWNCVFEDPSLGIDATKDFLLNQLGLQSCWRRPEDQGFDKPVHCRHQYCWRDIESGVVANYIKTMGDVALCGSSRDAAMGLLREIANDAIKNKWNVVVSNPLTDTMSNVMNGIDVHMRDRSGSTSYVQGGLRIGHATMSGQPFLAVIPGRFHSQDADAHDGMDNVEAALINLKAYSSQDSNPDLLSSLNPTLAIDFIKAKGDFCYVVLSFYWHGHRSDSYVCSVLNPDRPPLIPVAHRIIEQRHYISMTTLYRMLCDEVGEFDKEDFKRELKLSAEDSGLGFVSLNDARDAILSDNVVYSIAWVKENKTPAVEKDAEIVGLDLYTKIIQEGWNDYNGSYLNYQSLSANQYDFIIEHHYECQHSPGKSYPVYHWTPFQQKYGELTVPEMRHVNSSDREREIGVVVNADCELEGTAVPLDEPEFLMMDDHSRRFVAAWTEYLKSHERPFKALKCMRRGRNSFMVYSTPPTGRWQQPLRSGDGNINALNRFECELQVRLCIRSLERIAPDEWTRTTNERELGRLMGAQ